MFHAIAIRLAAGARRLSALMPASGLLRREDGAAAVEFALVAAPFLALLFAIMESALIFFASQTLETAVADSSRLILTGQAQGQGFDLTAFQQAVCQRTAAMFTCGNIMIDVRTSSSFSATNTSLPVDQNGNLQNNFTYSPGSPGDIVVVRLMYQWPVYVSLFGLAKSLSNMAGSTDLMMATAAFRNEPYQYTP
jgi:Flp pilus assembly protein TadG